MRKIPTLFVRDWNGNRSLVTREPNPECAWVFAGEGSATRKWDGTSCLVRDGKLYKRYELKPGKTPPEGFEPACPVDEETGKQPGWIPVGDGPEDHAHRDGWENVGSMLYDGTYELIGPKVQGNPDGFDAHQFKKHGAVEYETPVRDYDSLRSLLEACPIEGLVWHHPDGRMAKIKARDFGIPWPRK